MAEDREHGWLDRPAGVVFVVVAAVAFVVAVALRQLDAWWIVPAGIVFAMLVLVTLRQNRRRPSRGADPQSHPHQDDSA